MYETFNDGGLKYALLKLKDKIVSLLSEKVDKTQQATDTDLGLVKTNVSKNISLNAEGQLEVGGRLGKGAGTGLFSPDDREPRQVGNYSFLITDAKGMDMASNRSFALVSGLGVTCRSAVANSTEYRVQNTYANRLQCVMALNGYASRDESTSTQEEVVKIVSITVNGSTLTPSSAADSSSTTNDIVIKTEKTLNPSSTMTSIRLFGKLSAYATLHTGNGVASEGGGRNLLLGGGVTKATQSNDNCLVGNGIYSKANGNACFGRYHIAAKNRGFLAGTGHDTTNAQAEGVSALGVYSYIDSNTLFAVGNGTNHVTRSNAFEVTSDSGVVLKSPNGTRFKIKVDDSGNLTTTQI